MSHNNIFSSQLLNMSPSNLKQLKQYIVKTMQDNLLPFTNAMAEQEKDFFLSQGEIKNTKLTTIFTQAYKQKQLQVDTLANFILQFLTSLEDVYQQMTFKDKRINDLKSTINQQTDVIKRLQDDIQQYIDKLNNAEDYIHWMQEEMQYFDLLCMSNPRNSSSSTQLSKCRSQKTFTSTSSTTISQLFQQNGNNNTNISSKVLERKKKMDYDKIKFYIQSLKEQKNFIIKEYNMLLDQHERKLFECEKHSVLLDQLFEKYKIESMEMDVLTRVSSRRNLNSTREGESLCGNEGTNVMVKNYLYSFQTPIKAINNHKNNNNTSQDSQQVSICLHRENPQYLQSKIMKQSLSRNTLKMEYDQSFIQGNNSVLNSFMSEVYNRHNVKMDVGVNTKKVYHVAEGCQTQDCKINDGDGIQQDFLTKRQYMQSNSTLLPNKSKITATPQKTTKQDSFITNTQNTSNIKCQISINLKNLSTQEIKKIDFSKLISREVLGESNKTHGYTTCHRQKNKHKKHLCQHIYCFLTNKVVTERIKKYKYSRK